MRAVPLATALASLLATSLPTVAGAEVLGYGRIFNNDLFGDFGDKWRTGSYALSQIRGPGWDGARPEGFGQVIELRYRAEILAPGNIDDPRPGDRPYATASAFGLHTHFARGGADVSLGLDLVSVGSDTRIAAFQTALHELVGADDPTAAIEQGIDAELLLDASAELAVPVETGRGLWRPYAEARGGTETLVRIGGDYIIGGALRSDLLLRDVTTGQLHPGTDTSAGVAVVLGADAAYVADSVFLPEDRVTLEDARYRLRGAIHTQLGEGTSYFYGITYLTEEFEAQPEGQIVGSLRVNFNF